MRFCPLLIFFQNQLFQNIFQYHYFHTVASFLSSYLPITNSIVSFKIYDKQDGFETVLDKKVHCSSPAEVNGVASQTDRI